MNWRRVLRGLCLALLVPAIGFGQQTAAPAEASEFGRISGGEIELLTKQPRNLSGSLGLSMSRSSGPFAAGSLRGYEGSVGGTLLQDRMWFFASAQQQSGAAFSGLSGLQLPERAVTGAIDAKVMAQAGAGQSFSAFFESAKQAVPTMPSSASAAIVPSSFLSLHYTGIISSNMFFNASFSQRSLARSGMAGLPDGRTR